MRLRRLGLTLGALLLSAPAAAAGPAEANASVMVDRALVRLRQLLTPPNGRLESPGSPRFSALCDPTELGTRLAVGWLVPVRPSERQGDAAALADALGRDGEGRLASALPSLGQVTSAVTVEELGFAALLVVSVKSTRRGVEKELELGVLAAVARLSEETSVPAAGLARRVLTPLARAVVEVHPPETRHRAVRVRRPARHVIERGDTLSEIALRHGLDLEALVRLNGVDPKKPIRPGDELELDAGESRPKLHVAKPGEARPRRPGQKLVLPR